MDFTRELLVFSVNRKSDLKGAGRIVPVALVGLEFDGWRLGRGIDVGIVFQDGDVVRSANKSRLGSTLGKETPKPGFLGGGHFRLGLGVKTDGFTGVEVPFAEDLIGEDLRDVGRQEVGQIAEIGKNGIRDGFHEFGILEYGLNLGMIDYLHERGLTHAEIGEALVTGEVLKLGALAELENHWITGEARLDERIVIDQPDGIGSFVICRRHFVHGDRDAIHTRALEVDAHAVDEAQSPGIGIRCGDLICPVAQEENSRRQEHEIGGAVKQAHAQTEPMVDTFPHRLLHFVGLVFEMHFDLFMEDVADDLEDGQHEEEADAWWQKCQPDGMLKSQRGKQRFEKMAQRRGKKAAQNNANKGRRNTNYSLTKTECSETRYEHKS